MATATKPLPPLLAKSIEGFFRQHSPFSGMSAEHVALLARSARMTYYPSGERLIWSDDGPPNTLFLLQRGEVRSYEAASDPAQAEYITALTAGEMFPLGALIEGRAVVNKYIAATDTFCYEFDKAVFDQLLNESAPFASFCTRRVAHLLQESHRQLHADAHEEAHERQNMSSLVATLIRRVPITCLPSAPLREVLLTMHKQRIGSIICTSPENVPLGIFTERDVIDRVVLAGTPLDDAISKVMTPNPVTLDETASAFDAALLMARHAIRHVPITRGGKLAGLISERDLFSLQRVGMREVSRAIKHAEDIKALAAAANDVRALTRNMLAQGVAVAQLTQLIVALNDQLAARAILFAEREFDLGRFTWCWIALGSEGRMEQTISTDQDNGLVFEVEAGMDADTMRAELLPFAHRVNTLLAQIGFPLCKGNIMAGNPKWCLSLAEWKQCFGSWLRSPTPDALLNAAIFFDFRGLHGATQLADQLSIWLAEEAPRHANFLRMLATNAVSNTVPLGFLGDLPESGKIDLKGQGARPFVDAARVLALGRNIQASHTGQRLRLAANQAGLLKETEAMIDAFHFVQTLRLRRQFKSLEDGGAPNEVDLSNLNELDRRILREAFRQARKLQSRIKLDYAL